MQNVSDMEKRHVVGERKGGRLSKYVRKAGIKEVKKGEERVVREGAFIVEGVVIREWDGS